MSYPNLIKIIHTLEDTHLNDIQDLNTNISNSIDNIHQVHLSIIDNLSNSIDNLSNSKVDKTNPHITETWINGNNWYRIYSDGWIEQGGFMSGNSVYGWTTISFHKPYTMLPRYVHAYYFLGGSNLESNYWFTSNNNTSACATSDISCITARATTTSCTFQSYSSKYWYACGY